MAELTDYPRLRPIDARPSARLAGGRDLFDPSGVAESVITLSPAATFVVAQMDGRSSRVDIQVEYLRRFGRMLFSDDLDELIEQLDEACFLEGPRFETERAERTRRYRDGRVRACLNGHVPRGGFGSLGQYFDHLLRPASDRTDRPSLRGLIAPHLDYERGAPCYAASYGGLTRRTQATRVVVLGTNHFGRSTSVVGTRKDFETPFGAVAVDADFMQRLEDRCGMDLCAEEFDHVREQSVELQVTLLRHVMGDRRFTIAPFLCPDPCGSTGTAPRDGRGVDLRAFAEALAAEVEADESIFVIAGADLSHIGRYFHDPRELDEPTLQAIERYDRDALSHVLAGNAESFREAVAATENDTNICSVGCIYVATLALARLTVPRLAGYHQAVTREAENCVTCAAIEFLAR